MKQQKHKSIIASLAVITITMVLSMSILPSANGVEECKKKPCTGQDLQCGGGPTLCVMQYSAFGGPGADYGWEPGSGSGKCGIKPGGGMFASACGQAVFTSPPLCGTGVKL